MFCVGPVLVGLFGHYWTGKELLVYDLSTNTPCFGRLRVPIGWWLSLSVVISHPRQVGKSQRRKRANHPRKVGTSRMSPAFFLLSLPVPVSPLCPRQLPVSFASVSPVNRTIWPAALQLLTLFLLEWLRNAGCGVV